MTDRNTENADRPVRWGAIGGVLGGLAAIITAAATLLAVLGNPTSESTGFQAVVTSIPPVATAQVTTTAALASATTAPSFIAPTTAPPPVADAGVANRTSIDLVYNGDTAGCQLFLTVQVGDQTAQPTSNPFTMTNVLTGNQDYTIRGLIECVALGSCNAGGSGTIDVVSNGSYFVLWKNTAPGLCQAILQ